MTSNICIAVSANELRSLIVLRGVGQFLNFLAIMDYDFKLITHRLGI